MLNVCYIYMWYLNLNVLRENENFYSYFTAFLFDLSDAETLLLHENYVNTLVADALAPCVARTSAATALMMLVKQVLVFHKEIFQVTVPYEFWKFKYILKPSQTNSALQGSTIKQL